MSFSKPQVSFSWNFAWLFSVMKDNSSVRFWSNVIYFARKGPIKVQIFETFECSDQNSPNSCHFWNNKLVFLQILHHSSVSWDITPLYFFSWNFIYFQQKKPIKVKIWWNFTWVVESLKFCSLMASFCKNKVSANKVQKSDLSWHWRVMQNLKKNWFVVSNMTWGMVLTKMRNDLKRPTTSQKRPKTTYNDLQQARKDMKRPETTYSKQEATWSDLQRPEKAYNEQETT